MKFKAIRTDRKGVVKIKTFDKCREAMVFATSPHGNAKKCELYREGELINKFSF